MHRARNAANTWDRLLIVEDDAKTREWMAEVLMADGYQPESVPDVAEALIRLRSQTFAVIILDQHLPGLSGLDLLPGIRTLCPHTAVVMTTGDATAGVYRQALANGAFDLLVKPLSIALLIRTVRSARRFARTQRRSATGGFALQSNDGAPYTEIHPS